MTHKKNAGDFFILRGRTRDSTWYVSRTTAVFIEDELKRRRVPEWIVFVDLAGSRVRLATRAINCVEQCSPEQRRARFEILRALDEEAVGDES